MPTKKKKQRKLYVTLRGVSFYATPTTIKRISEECPLKVTLEREPENLQDRNAVKIVLDEKPWKGFHVGHVARQTAMAIAPKMDSGDFKVKEAWLLSLEDDGDEGRVMILH